ncbi:twitch domain-containing radical SAM protein [bacterium]|nr:twitch domain-containing radical SAM protein [bacterium]
MNDFCLAPWTHTYISPQGERRLCCASREPAQNFKQYIDTDAADGEFKPLTLEEWWNGEHVRKIRRKWLSGQVPKECEVCDKKLLNTSVYRDYFGHLFGHLRGDIISSTDNEGYTTLTPISWDYRYSNVCNFKCRMCGDMLSSAWEVEVRKNDMVDLNNPKNYWMQPKNRHAIRDFTRDVVIPEFRQAIENKNVREIYWVGGEPLLYDEHWTFMRRIIELGYAEQVRVRYNTNLSYIKDKDGTLWDLLQHFPHWEICASLDGTGDIGEYIRSGLNYNDWIDNFKQGIQQQRHPRQMRIDFTLTLPGLYDLANIICLADTLNVSLLSKVVFAFSPDILLSPLALPRNILISFIEDIQESIKPLITPRTQSLWDVLEHLKTRPTFEEQFPHTFKQEAINGKRHILKLEYIRKDVKIKIENILTGDVLDWWNNI